MILLAPVEPVQRNLHRLFGLSVVGAVLAANIESHDNVRTERVLYLHRNFRRDKVPAAVDMRVERNALFGNFSDTGKRENLKSAAVGQNRLIPRHKLMQSARFLDQLVPGAHVQVIGV